MSIPGEDLPRLRSHLLRYAMLQLRDAALAEDVVQETLLAALNDSSRFSGKSARRTWLVGILKHKIIDALRKKSREQSLVSVEEISEAEVAEDLFADDGHWRQFPSDWGDPAKSFEDKKFWEAFERCLEGIPERAARAFMLRECLGVTSDEICKELGITPSNLWVLLHRARLSLRGCLECKWFGGPDG